VVVRRSEVVEVVRAQDGDGVFGCAVTDGTGPALQTTLSDVVGRLCADEETVASHDRVSCEGSLKKRAFMIVKCEFRAKERTNADNIHSSSGVQTALLIVGMKYGGLCVLLGHQRRHEVELETFRELVLQLKFCLEHIGGVPRLGEDDAVLVVGVLDFEVARDEVSFSAVVSIDFERDVGWSTRLDLQ
jgi:hypothetical protein